MENIGDKTIVEAAIEHDARIESLEKQVAIILDSSLRMSTQINDMAKHLIKKR